MPQPPKLDGWTEDEAKQIECPMCMTMAVKFADSPAAHCVASDCMAWRWVKGSTDHGFCGMAGTP
jgi:hypothetical protein